MSGTNGPDHDSAPIKPWSIRLSLVRARNATPMTIRLRRFVNDNWRNALSLAIFLSVVFALPYAFKPRFPFMFDQAGELWQLRWLTVIGAVAYVCIARPLLRENWLEIRNRATLMLAYGLLIELSLDVLRAMWS